MEGHPPFACAGLFSDLCVLEACTAPQDFLSPGASPCAAPMHGPTHCRFAAEVSQNGWPLLSMSDANNARSGLGVQARWAGWRRFPPRRLGCSKQPIWSSGRDLLARHRCCASAACRSGLQAAAQTQQQSSHTHRPRCAGWAPASRRHQVNQHNPYPLPASAGLPPLPPQPGSPCAAWCPVAAAGTPAAGATACVPTWPRNTDEKEASAAPALGLVRLLMGVAAGLAAVPAPADRRHAGQQTEG